MERCAVSSVAVRTLRGDVVEGPDTGATFPSLTESLTVGTATKNGLVLTDPTVSRFHAKFVSHPHGVSVIDQGSLHGTWYSGARVERAIVAPGSSVHLGQTCVRVLEGDGAEVEVLNAHALVDLRGRSAAMRRVMAIVQNTAQAVTPVLIAGERGAGKKVVAETLHTLSERPGAFVTVDCAAPSAMLVASELFGHEKGAFAGAHALQLGALERADRGTIFLDEIGDLPPQLQDSLLGIIERRRFRRVGGNEDIGLDVRLVCSTSRDLRVAVNGASFGLDLYNRIAGCALEVPPLRDRPDDILILVEQFLRDGGCVGAVSDFVPTETIDELRKQRWPGNVRELKSFVEALLSFGQPPPFYDPALDGDTDLIGRLIGKTYREARTELLGLFEKRFLRALMDRAQNDQSRAALEAGLDGAHLKDLLRKHQFTTG